MAFVYVVTAAKRYERELAYLYLKIGDPEISGYAIYPTESLSHDVLTVECQWVARSAVVYSYFCLYLAFAYSYTYG